MNKLPTLTDDKLVLRPFEPGDTDLLFEAVRESISELSTWMVWCNENYSIEESRAFIMSRAEDAGEYSFAIIDAGTNKLIGGLGINQINRTYKFANLGYWVRSSRAGQGVASSATRLAARFALEELDLQRIEILAAVGNVASQRAAEKAGATREGVLRKRLVKDGEPRDAVMYSLVMEDLR